MEKNSKIEMNTLRRPSKETNYEKFKTHKSQIVRILQDFLNADRLIAES